jgi:hypothetical protein
MPVRAHMPGYRWFHAFRNAAIRTGVYGGVCLSMIMCVWVIVANRMPALEQFALWRNVAAVSAIGLIALLPVLRFIRHPGSLLLSGLVGWFVFSLNYWALTMRFAGLAEQHGAFQVFMLGAVAYLLAATISWVGTIVWRLRTGHATSASTHSRHHLN